MKKINLYLIMLITMISLVFASTSITINHPEALEYMPSRTIVYNFTVSGGEVGYNCTYYAHNTSSNTWTNLKTDANVASGSTNTRSVFTDLTDTNASSGVNNGVYKWEVKCKNNETGAYPEDSANTTFYMVRTQHNSSCVETGYSNDTITRYTNYNPRFYWTNYSAIGGYSGAFSRYVVYVSNESDGSPVIYEQNYTSVDTLSAQMDLTSLRDGVTNDDFYWFMNTLNQGGTVNNATNCTRGTAWNYRTMEIGGTLTAGWNVLAVDDGTADKNASTIWNDIGLSAANGDVIAKYNSSKLFQSYTGTSANQGMLFNQTWNGRTGGNDHDNVIFIYTSVENYWENRSTPSTASSPERVKAYNLTAGYNFIPVYNSSGRTINEYDVAFNYTFNNITYTNVSYISWWNNSGQEYISSFRNWGVNNGTKMSYYETFVVYLEQSAQMRFNRTWV